MSFMVGVEEGVVRSIHNTFGRWVMINDTGLYCYALCNSGNIHKD